MLQGIKDDKGLLVTEYDDDDDDCFKVAQASRHSGYPLLPNRDSYFSHSCTTTWQPE